MLNVQLCDYFSSSRRTRILGKGNLTNKQAFISQQGNEMMELSMFFYLIPQSFLLSLVQNSQTLRDLYTFTTRTGLAINVSIVLMQW